MPGRHWRGEWRLHGHLLVCGSVVEGWGLGKDWFFGMNQTVQRVLLSLIGIPWIYLKFRYNRHESLLRMMKN